METFKDRFKKIGFQLYVFFRAAGAAVVLGCLEVFGSARGRRYLAAAALVGLGVLLWFRPPVQVVPAGEVGVRVNRLTGGVSVVPEGPTLMVPLVHDLRRYSLRDQIYRPTESATAEGPAPFQSVEGLSIGVAVTVRYALDPARVGQVAKRLPVNVGADLIEPVVDGVLHRALSKRTVREIFTDKRAEIQDDIQGELRDLLGKDGITVRSLYLGHVDLPAQYRAGLEGMLSEELATEKMRYTLQLKEKKVKESELEGDAAKVQREKAAEAAASEEIIAAKAREEAMKHVLPLKEKEIEQRRLEAEARKVQRMKDAEGDAEARKIETAAEADSRRKLSDADAYRIEVTGKANADQLARDSALIAKNPLLIQKTLADKLSDKIQVIVAPPSAGGFFAGGLLGLQARAGAAPATPSPPVANATPAHDNAAAEGE
ncbi:MAG TPA: SPFH domain-containing protein [Polyangia bacterium]|jgi:regulator of protease activity HflC (stomatin/prohibitin superfamily)|nr:SPFH domain-containing protein [Polyangia bacterium]